MKLGILAKPIVNEIVFISITIFFVSCLLPWYINIGFSIIFICGFTVVVSALLNGAESLKESILRGVFTGVLTGLFFSLYQYMGDIFEGNIITSNWILLFAVMSLIFFITGIIGIVLI